MLFPSGVENWAEGRLLPRLEDLRCSSEPAVTSSSDFPTGICGRVVLPKRTFVNSLTQHGSPAEFVPVVQQSAAATHKSAARRPVRRLSTDRRTVVNKPAHLYRSSKHSVSRAHSPLAADDIEGLSTESELSTLIILELQNVAPCGFALTSTVAGKSISCVAQWRGGSGGHFA